jgi:hypothetical protein
MREGLGGYQEVPVMRPADGLIPALPDLRRYSETQIDQPMIIRHTSPEALDAAVDAAETESGLDFSPFSDVMPDFRIERDKEKAREAAYGQFHPESRQAFGEIDRIKKFGLALSFENSDERGKEILDEYAKAQERYVEKLADFEKHYTEDEGRAQAAVYDLLQKYASHDIGRVVVFDEEESSPLGSPRKGNWEQIRPYVEAFGLPHASNRGGRPLDLQTFTSRTEKDDRAIRQLGGWMEFVQQHREIVDPTIPLPNIQSGQKVRVFTKSGHVAEDWVVSGIDEASQRALVHLPGTENLDSIDLHQLQMWNKKLGGEMAEELQPEARPNVVAERQVVRHKQEILSTHFEPQQLVDVIDPRTGGNVIDAMVIHGVKQNTFYLVRFPDGRQEEIESGQLAHLNRDKPYKKASPQEIAFDSAG